MEAGRRQRGGRYVSGAHGRFTNPDELFTNAAGRNAKMVRNGQTSFSTILTRVLGVSIRTLPCSAALPLGAASVGWEK